MRGSAKLLKNSTRERKEILIAPLKRPRLSRPLNSLSSCFPITHNVKSAFGPKSCGTDGKLTAHSRIQVPEENTLGCHWS